MNNDADITATGSDTGDDEVVTLVNLSGPLCEQEAAQIVAALELEGIEARAAGGNSANFRIEIITSVSVFVRKTDFDRALAVLAEVRKAGDEIDWEQIDVGQPEDGQESA